MNYILLIIYCTLVFGIHGGEGITGINRQIRNLLCVIPFAIVYSIFSWQFAIVNFILAYVGVSLGFKGYLNYDRLVIKGLITCPLGGFIGLPLVYGLSYKTKHTNELAEYISGTMYGILLALVYYAKA